MIVDLHAHYPMHLDPGLRGNLWSLLRTRRGQLEIRDHLRALGENLASQFANYPSLFSRERVRINWMAEGGVGVAYSVLYSFFDEADRSPPGPREYTDVLLRQARLVEQSLKGRDAVVARSPRDLALVPGKVTLVHCVEGGFHLGGTPEAVDQAVTELARRGVAYIILPHLFWRGVATNANALPFLSDRVYHLLFRQPKLGLSDLGRARRGAAG